MESAVIGQIISILSLAVACIVAFTNLRRNNLADDKKEASEMTTVIVKLENINTGINEIKADVRNVKSEVQDLRERVVVVEQSAKSLHKRVDTMEGRKEITD